MTVTDLPRQVRPTGAHRETGAPDRTPRWMPLRAGILNIWRYHDEILSFDNGRLLLRGPNGSGKSKALEVLLPFLFDASLRANRLSTFGTTERTMHWNLMGDGYDSATRVGFVWLEFGRADGSRFSCGVRLRASRHTTIVTPDFFTTAARIGDDLRLVDAANVPLSRAELAQELVGHGELYTAATDYRNAVRRNLFPGMNEQRYDALIQAMLQLRTPKLSQHLDPGVVSTLLSRALPPLDQAEITELAEGFERLDRQREQLVTLDAEVEAATGLLGSARGYAQRVLRAASDTVIKATSTMTSLTREAGESETRHDQAVDERRALDKRQQTAQQAFDDHATRIEALKARDSYREGQQLDQLREQTRAALAGAAQRATAASKRRGAATQAELAAGHADRESTSQQATVQDAARDAARVAERASMSAALTRAEDALESGSIQARSQLVAAIESRERQIAVVRVALGSHAEAVRDRLRAEAHVQDAVDAEDAAGTEEDAADTAYEAALLDHQQRLAAWAEQLTEIRVDRTALLDAAVDGALLAELVGGAAGRVLETIAGQETAAGTRRREHEATRGAVADELAQRRARTELAPDPPPHRTADRTVMDGAPLWRLVRFAEGVDEASQAGIEAGLQASGLLDAWVTPAGDVLLCGGHDTFAIADPWPPSQRAEATRGATLDSVLRAEVDSPVDAGLVDRLLASIGYGDRLPAEGAAAIGADGRWRLAGLTGSWSISHPAHIGATARERARLARIADLETRLLDVDAEISAVDADLAALEQRRRVVAAEGAARPNHSGLDAAKERLRKATARLEAAQEGVATARIRLADAESAVAVALRRVSSIAASNGLPAEDAALTRLASTLADLRTAGGRWLDAVSEHRHARSRAALLAAAARLAVESAAEEEEFAAQAHTQARQLQVRLEALAGAVAAPYLELLAEIEREQTARDDARRSADELGRSVAALAERIGELRERRREAADRRDDAVRSRDVAAERFRHLAGSVLSQDAGADVDLGGDGVRATLEAARQLAAAWPTVPYERKNVADAAARLTEAVHQVRELLAARAELEVHTDVDVHLVTAGIDGGRLSVAGLLDRLRADRDRGRADITASERELFDKTLTGDTRRHLAARIRQAGELVERMNDNLEQVRTASNVSVKLTWQVDKALPAGTAAARDLLLTDPVRLREEDREALHRFFRDRIDQAREANTATGWEHQLREVFDYTAWHQFLVRIDRRDGNGWQELTRRLHGALSGGEKAIALHLPLFAAVAAYYESVPEAPRLIMLDEVFVGVDSANRGQVFGLLAALDLDLVLTSDHEWCTYRELDGIAVHQLTTGVDGDDAVTTVRFVWTGARLVAEDAASADCAAGHSGAVGAEVDEQPSGVGAPDGGLW